MMVNYGEAIKRPFQDIKKLIIGIFLSMIPIVNLLALGYILENTKSAMKKKYALTEWTGWGELFIKGLLLTVITIIYALPAIIIAIFVIGIAAAKSMLTSMTLTFIPTLGIGIFAVIVLALFAAYVSPAAVLNYAHKNKFAAAFDFREIKKRFMRKEYLAAWFLGSLYSAILTFVLAWLPWLGAGIASFIGSMTMYTMLAETWAGK
ncbi:MAG: DUF4013 domain-containing protein [archaeon]